MLLLLLTPRLARLGAFCFVFHMLYTQQSFAIITLSSCLQVMVNEEVDPALVIKRLKQEIRDLKDEIRSGKCLYLNGALLCMPYQLKSGCTVLFCTIFHCDCQGDE